MVGGAGSCQLTLTTAGTPTLTATYPGDANFLTSTSAGVSQTVNPASSGSVTLSSTSLVFGNQLVGTTSAAQTVRLFPFLDHDMRTQPLGPASLKSQIGAVIDEPFL